MNYKNILSAIDKKSIPSVVLLYGEEVYLIDCVLKAAKEKYVSKEFESMNYSEFEKIEQDFSSFYESVSTFPFMTDTKICVVNDATFLTSTGSLTKGEEDKIIDLIEKNYDTCMLFFVIKNGKADARKRIMKKLKEKNSIFEINRIDEMDLTKYITGAFKKANINISMTDANYIANNSGYLEYESHVSLYDIGNEIDKMASYAMHDKTIDRQVIDKLMIKSVESNIFKLVDYICEGKIDKSSEIVEEMLLNNTPEPYIIHMIIRQYRMLYQYVLLTNSGYNMNDIMEKMKIKKFIASKLMKLSKNLTSDKIQVYMDVFMDIDRKIKTGEIDKRIGLEIITNGTVANN